MSRRWTAFSRSSPVNREVEPHVRLHVVPQDAAPGVVHGPEVELCGGLSRWVVRFAIATLGRTSVRLLQAVFGAENATPPLIR